MSHFIEEYMGYASAATDAPRIYHEAAALATLAAAAGRGVGIQHGHVRIHPNLWIIILGGSTSYRKSTSLGISRDLIWELNKDKILPDDFSVEAFMETLSARPQSVLYFAEFLSLSSKLGRDYMSGLKSLLTELYDCPPEVRRELRRKGNTKREDGKPAVDVCLIRNPCLSILCASTSSWFTEKLTESDFMGGFIPRFCLVPAVKEDLGEEMFVPAARDVVKRDELVRWLAEIQNMQGDMHLADVTHYTEAMKAFARRWTPRGEEQDHLFGPYFDRLRTVALKAAMLHRLGEPKLGLDIRPENVDYGFAWVQELAVRVELIRARLGFSDHEKLLMKLENLFASGKTIKREEILRKIRIPAWQLDQALTTLIDSGSITSKVDPGMKEANPSHSGRNPTVYRKVMEIPPHYISPSQTEMEGVSRSKSLCSIYILYIYVFLPFLPYQYSNSHFHPYTTGAGRNEGMEGIKTGMMPTDVLGADPGASRCPDSGPSWHDRLPDDLDCLLAPDRLPGMTQPTLEGGSALGGGVSRAPERDLRVTHGPTHACATCLWFVPKAEQPIGRCRRHAPTMGGFPAVYPRDFCGDHKIDGTKL